MENYLPGSYTSQLSVAAVALTAVVFIIFRLAGRWRKSLPTGPHVLDFPPQRRHVLVTKEELEKGISPKAKEMPPAALKKRAMPMAKTVDLTKKNLYTPTGFSTQDISNLGRFPDYSLLSGVRNPEPCGPEFDIKKAVFRPFRPFRWAYHQHMALMRFEPDYWVELEKNYFSMIAARKKLLETHGDRVFFHLPGSELACRELMEMLLQCVSKRYPQYFSIENENTVFRNRLLNTESDLVNTDPLRVIFDNIPEDYALMMRNEEDGFYYLRAAMVCSSVGWDIAQHIGEPMKDIHTHVPDASKIGMSINRYFSKMSTEQPIQRCSWSLEDYETLWSSPEVVKDWTRSSFATNPEDMKAEHIKLRCDWQTLRRLPLSSSIIFNFKAVFTPLEELRDEPYVPALLHKVLNEGKENLITYKCLDTVRQVAMKALDGWAKEQVEKGIVPEDWEVQTLEESPFFPGWKEKWHAKQGF